MRTFSKTALYVHQSGHNVLNSLPLAAAAKTSQALPAGLEITSLPTFMSLFGPIGRSKKPSQVFAGIHALRVCLTRSGLLSSRFEHGSPSVVPMYTAMPMGLCVPYISSNEVTFHSVPCAEEPDPIVLVSRSSCHKMEHLLGCPHYSHCLGSSAASTSRSGKSKFNELLFREVAVDK